MVLRSRALCAQKELRYHFTAAIEPSCCDISFYPVAVMQHFLSWSKFIYREATWVSMILSGNVQFFYFAAHEFNAFPVYFFIILSF